MKSPLNLRQELIRSIAGVGVMYLLAVPVGLLTSIILARSLGPESFGQYSFVLALLALLALPASGGIPQLLTREIARFKHSGQWSLYRGAVRAAHVWVLFVGGLVLAAYFSAGPILGLIPGYGKWALLGIVVVLVPLQGLNSVRNGTIKGLGFPALAEMPTSGFQPLFFLAVVALLAFVGDLSARSALWGQVVVASVTFVLGSLLFFRLKPQAAESVEPDYQSKAWLVALFPFTLISLVGMLNTQMGIVLLGLLGADESVAALRVGERAAQFVAVPLGLVNMVISPHIAKAYQAGNLGLVQRLSRSSARGAFVLALPVGVVLILFGRFLISVAFGEAYPSIAYFPMVILVVSQLFNVAMGSVAMLLVMCGYEKFTLRGQLAGLVVTISMAIILIPIYQAVGAALAVGTGLLVWNCMMGISVIKTLNIRPGFI